MRLMKSFLVIWMNRYHDHKIPSRASSGSDIQESVHWLELKSHSSLSKQIKKALTLRGMVQPDFGIFLLMFWLFW